MSDNTVRIMGKYVPGFEHPDVTITLDYSDAIELLEVLRDRPRNETWSDRVLSELRSAL